MARAAETRAKLLIGCRLPAALLEPLDGWIAHAERQIEQIRRRVLRGERIPHHEKVFSIFQPHTEWISKGKAGVPVELGLRVAVSEDQYGFILHHHVMEKITDDQGRRLIYFGPYAGDAGAIDILALMGDKADNVPGVHGIGEKGAMKLIKEYGTVENLLEHAEDVSGKKAREGLIAHKLNER